MIQREMRYATATDFAKFDYFNDADDTIKWLESLIREMPDRREQLRLGKIVTQLKSGLEAFCQVKSDDFRRKQDLNSVAQNPDGTYNGVKALKWIADALGGNLTEAEIQAEWEKAKQKKGQS